MSTFVDKAVQRFNEYNNPNLLQRQRHESLKSFLLQECPDGRLECKIKCSSNKSGYGYIDFIGGGYAVEIDKSSKIRSMTKLKQAVDEGYKAVWLIFSRNGRLPRHFGRRTKQAESYGIEVMIVKYKANNKTYNSHIAGA